MRATKAVPTDARTCDVCGATEVTCENRIPTGWYERTVNRGLYTDQKSFPVDICFRCMASICERLHDEVAVRETLALVVKGWDQRALVERESAQYRAGAKTIHKAEHESKFFEPK